MDPDEAVSQPTTFTPEQTRRLEAGETLAHFWRLKSGDAGAGWAVGVIDAPPEKVFKVVADVERYKEFMERMAETKIVSRDGDRYRFYYRINMPWPLSDHYATTDNVHEIDQAKQTFTRRWTLVSGTFHRNEGAWGVRPWGKGRSLLTYSVVLRPRVAAPDAVLDHVTKVSLPKGIERIRKRVLALIKARQL